LIDDICASEESQHAASRYFEWRLVVRQFYRTSLRILSNEVRSLSDDPREQTLEEHRALSETLLRMGREILAELKTLSSEELSRFGISLENATAAFDCLQLEQDEWHNSVLSAEEIAALQKKIFGAAA